MRLSQLPPEWRARLREEQRQAGQAANSFARVCCEGDADHLYDAHLLLNECAPGAWRRAMARVAKLPRVSLEIQDAFIAIWVESKMLPLHVGHRPTMAAALRVLMPGGHSCPPAMLYRGANTYERRRRLYGFSWTTNIAVARTFAEHWPQPVPPFPSANPLPPMRGVILRTVAPPEAILLIRQPEEYYDEGEVVVDPFRLGKVEVVEHL